MSWLKGRSKGTYASLRTRKPVARSEDLVIEEVEDEVLVYDAKNHQAHCLTSAGAKVWRACDGTKDVPALAESLALSVDDVTRALEMLDGVELLENQGLQIVTNGNGNGNGLTRRELGRRSAKVGAAAAAAPMLLSIAVPSASAAATPTNFQCALFSVDSCGVNAGGGAVAGCCCCCEATNCKVGGSTNTCASVTGPDGKAGHCSSSCSANQCGTTANPNGCCSIAGSVGCGCAFSNSAAGNICGQQNPPAGCAAGCTPGAVNCGAGCCNPNTGAGCVPGQSNCVPCCNGVPITSSATFNCCTPGTTNTCA
jgi:hypothetical protein